MFSEADMQITVMLTSGLLFGFGLIVSGLVNPAKVLNFLDFTGAWDPSLAFTMAAAVLTTAIGYGLAFRRKAPLLGGSFQLPTATDVDKRLIGGAALFGVGWGLVGFCPGPAVSALATGSGEALIFVVAMLGGMGLARNINTVSDKAAPAQAAPQGGNQ
jgi:hypothetical protein